MPEPFYPFASFGLQKRSTMRFEADVFECEVEGEIPEVLLGGERGPYRDIVLLNAGAALIVGGKATNLTDGVAIDRDAARLTECQNCCHVPPRPASGCPG